ncbi:PREDICTED: uncharacterized protein LOC109219285 [Nicotiana attenuata]|uniref:uncharacterized protein LOC109219285 n=1 Tax=Nicotiana attenuata TaxID=49451 RepID=UPI00090505ED|nr:PREDICTED: uncharacterized protein LOC109219285 [Nicotiana attenuata]
METLPFKYLGVPLSSRKLSIHQCLPLVERITNRIKCWTSKLLSYSGQLQLIKSVLFEMQTYRGQVFIIPKKIIQLVNAVCRIFLWTGNYSPSKRTLIARERICMPTSAGGLNVISFEWWNRAAICKMMWAIHVKKDALWIKWIHAIYIKKEDITVMQTPRQASWLVKKIFDIRDWYKKIETVANMDKFCVKGKFSIHKMYTLSRPQYPKVEWKALTLGNGIPRHNFVLWLALNHRLTTVDRLAKWEIQVDQDCIGTRLEEVAWMSKRARSGRAQNNILVFLFAAVTYQVWTERNMRRFQGKEKEAERKIRDIVLQIQIKGQQNA